MVAEDRVAVRKRSVRAASENADLIDIPQASVIDRVLRRLPERHRVLAAPPRGSATVPVHGDIGLPYLGRALHYMRWGPAEMVDRHRRYGPVALNSSLGIDRVLVSGPEAIDEVLGSRRRDFGQGWDYFIGPFFRRGLLLLEFDEHMYHRRIMQQAFTRERLAAHLAALTPVARAAVARWVPPGRDRTTVRLYPTVKELTLEIAGETFMAVDVGARRRDLIDAFVDCTHAGLSIVRHPIPGGRWRAGLHGRRVLEQYFTEMLPAKRRSRDPDFFSGLCHARSEDGAVFSDADVVNHMIFLIMAAHDTTTTTATAVAYYLGKHPEWQRRVRAEVLAADAETGDAATTIADLDRLRDLDLVVKESLRLMPPVPGLVRRAVRDTEILGHYIPAGTAVDLAYQVNHLLPELWTRPEVFDPLRFAEPRREDHSHRLAFLPFGAGAHKCIGMHFGTFEVKTLISAMVRDYEWEIPDDYRMPWGFTTIPFPRDGAPMLLRRRA
ncbi:cytochrome P450 [Nocardia amikacinitolerans]|uniref:cytochrome P450 n=1 Tax=Nocardia amikacinitolerans TaxID=756689 RepID=UPI0020A5BCAD|nr:cytochrome P450 [Nocardia amikacinitolerans]MCP2275785.1 Cytochrome P450 [Nocardia amikacinitolerans]